jgi:2-oxoisovalerate dehydrogenase E1 component
VGRADAASGQSPRHLGPVDETPLAWRQLDFAEERVVKSIRGALEVALANDPRVILIGEDIRSPYGGAFKVTQGLSDQFPDRVLNTPISEAAIVGVGSGLALEGMRPVVEIMFGDFVLLAADQFVNHAAKFRWMYNEQVQVPLIVRTPMGGHRGYGPTHSQSLEKHLLGVPDTQVLAIHARYSPGTVYRSLFDTIDRPTLVIENKILYGQLATSRAPDGFVVEHSNTRFPTTRLRPIDGVPDLTLVAYGGMVQEAEAAMLELFTEHDLLCELIIPLSLYPLDLRPMQDSVARSGALVVVEEGQGFAGFSGELSAALVERGHSFRLRRVAAAPHPIPTSRPFERAVLPTMSSIVRAAVELQND